MKKFATIVLAVLALNVSAQEKSKSVKVKKTTFILIGVTVVAYIIGFGAGNFMVLMTLLYLLNHFYLENAVKNFQNNLWPRFQAFYARLLAKALNWPRAMLWGTVALFFFTIGNDHFRVRLDNHF